MMSGTPADALGVRGHACNAKLEHLPLCVTMEANMVHVCVCLRARTHVERSQSRHTITPCETLH